MEYPGHVNGLFNAANQVVNEYRYDPWGETTAVTEAVQQPLRYMARELGPITGLYYVRNRWYDPVANRFVSEDPIGLAGGINLYAYAYNAPTLRRDPSGLLPEDGDQCEELARFIENVSDRPAFIAACKRMTMREFSLAPIIASASSWQYSTPREGRTYTNFGPGAPSYNYPHIPFGETIMAQRAAEERAEWWEQRKARHELERRRYRECLGAETAGKFGTEAAWEFTWAAGGALFGHGAKKSVAGALRGGLYGVAIGISQEALEITFGATYACSDVNDLGSEGSW